VSTRPATLRIIGKSYRVEWPDSIELEGNHVSGLSDPDNQLIQVLASQPLENAQDGLLHEVMHCLEAAFDLDLDETVVQRLATGLLAVLKDNPKFVAYLRRRK
jgi:hypothetical protein